MTSSLLPSFPFWRSPRLGNLRHLLQLNSQRKLTVRSPHYLTKRVRWISKPHQQKMLVQFPFQKRKAAGLRGTPSKESTGQFGVSSDKEDDSVVTVSDDGSDPNGASTPLVDDTHLSQETESGGRTIRCATYKETSTGDETAPQQEQSSPAKTTEAVLIATRNELYGKTIRLSKRYGPAFSGWTLT